MMRGVGMGESWIGMGKGPIGHIGLLGLIGHGF
mgnify:CR=1 FL=1